MIFNMVGKGSGSQPVQSNLIATPFSGSGSFSNLLTTDILQAYVTIPREGKFSLNFTIFLFCADSGESARILTLPQNAVVIDSGATQVTYTYNWHRSPGPSTPGNQFLSFDVTVGQKIDPIYFNVRFQSPFSAVQTLCRAYISGFLQYTSGELINIVNSAVTRVTP